MFYYNYFLCNIYNTMVCQSFKIKLPHAQLKSLTQSKGVNIKPEYIDDSPADAEADEYMLSVEEPNLKKLEKVLTTGKGFRLKLGETEDIMNKTGGKLKGLKHLGKKAKSGESSTVHKMEGGKFSFKKAAKKASKSVSNSIDKGVEAGKKAKVGRKARNVGLEVAKDTSKATFDVLLPAAAAALTAEMGPAAQLGAASAVKVLGDRAQGKIDKKLDSQKRGGKDVGGKIRFKKALKKAKVGKKIGKAAKKIGKTALMVAAETAGQAATDYTGDARIGNALTKSIQATGDTAFETGDVGKSLAAGGKSAMKDAKNIAVEFVDDFVEEQFGPESAMVSNIEAGLTGKFPDQAALVDDSQDITTGSGLMNNVKGRRRCSVRGGRVMLSSHMGGRRMRQHSADGMQTLVDGPIGPVRTVPGADIQTGSPFNRMNSPSNYPFVSSSPQLMDAVSRGRMGGSMYPAGRMGGSMYPAGRMGGSCNSMYPPGKMGGSFLPAGRRRGGSFMAAGR